MCDNGEFLLGEGIAVDDVVDNGSGDDDDDIVTDEEGVVDMDEGIAVDVEAEGITVVETMMVDVNAGGVKPPYVHSGSRGI